MKKSFDVSQERFDALIFKLYNFWHEILVDLSDHDFYFVRVSAIEFIVSSPRPVWDQLLLQAQ